MPLGDSPRDPKPSPRMLELIRLAEEANERTWRERLQRELLTLLWSIAYPPVVHRWPQNPHADHDYPVTAA